MSSIQQAHYDAKREGTRGKPRDYRSAIAELDATSRTRALTEAESIMLERMLWRVEKKATMRAGYGTRKELVRAGIKRGDLRRMGLSS